MRLETRFADDPSGSVLLQVRIYPDEVHVDAHDPRLTAREQVARAAWSTSARDLQAWRDLTALVGPPRAAYLASLAATADPGVRDAAWSSAPRARLLPDRWQVIVEGTGVATVRVTTKDVTAELAVGLDPDDPGEIAADAVTLAPDTAWLADYAAAVDAGMAATVPLPHGTVGPLRVLVVGVRDRDPEAEATALAALIDAHHFTDGVGILAAGTPTNHTSDTAAPWSSLRATADATFAIERGVALASDSSSTGAHLAWAFGVSANVFDHIAPAEGGAASDAAWWTLDEQAAAMQRALWPGTLGYFLEQMLAGAFLDGEPVEKVRQFFLTNVRNRGPLPTLRIGRNPYGVLPVIATGTWAAATNDPVDARLLQVLNSVRAVLGGSAASAPRLGPASTDQDLTRVLSMSPVSTTYAGRSVVGASYASYLYDFLNRPLDLLWWTSQNTRASAAWRESLLPDLDTRLLRATYDGAHFPISDPVVQGDVGGATLSPNYLATLRDASLAQLRAASNLPGTTPLLYRLVRHSAMASFLAAARRELFQQLPSRVVLEPEMIGLSTGLSSPWTWLNSPARVGGLIGNALQTARTGTGGLRDAAFLDCWHGIAAIAQLTPARLDSLTRETLDLCSHRLDAWLTGVAMSRLRALPRISGLHIGGYGAVENLVRAPARSPIAPPAGEVGSPLFAAADPGGLIHAPSPAHATTAALLRSGFLAHAADGGAVFSVDVRSSRVRMAREILAAVRAGDTLGQVLGRQVERAVTDATSPTLWQYLLILRGLAPGDPAFPDGTTLDGYALAKLVRPPAAVLWGQAGLPAATSAAANSLQSIFDELVAAIDALGDVLVAESVHQLAQGNPARASGVLDALAQGTPPPATLGVTDVPASGTGLSHRVMAVVPARMRAVGWAATPRAAAEPALEAWCAAMLGPAIGYQIRVRFLAGDASELATLTLELDALGLGALDLTRAASTGDLAALVLDAASQAAPASAAGAVKLVIDPVRLAGHRSLDDAILIGGALADALAGARAVGPADLAGVADPDASTVTDPATAADVEGRLADAVLGDALVQLAMSPRAGLRAACALGVAGAVPSIDPAAWPAQVAAAAAALTARQAKLAALAPLAPGASPDERIARAIERLRLLVGDDVVIAPQFTAPASDLSSSLADQAALRGGDATTSAAWLSTVCTARRELAAFERVVFTADVLTPGDPALAIQLAQLPFTAGEPWIGSAVYGGDASPTATRGFAIHAPLGLDLDAPIAGLLIDTWSESVPASTQTTGVAFQIEQPTAAPPQLIVLAVASDLGQPTWTPAALEDVVRETLALADLRLLDGDLIDAGGHFLPALYFAINLAGDTASTDFTGST